MTTKTIKMDVTVIFEGNLCGERSTPCPYEHKENFTYHGRCELFKDFIAGHHRGGFTRCPQCIKDLGV